MDLSLYSNSTYKITKKEEILDFEGVIMADNVEYKENQAGRHQEVGHKSLLQSDALYQVGFYFILSPDNENENGVMFDSVFIINFRNILENFLFFFSYIIHFLENIWL